MVSEKELLEGIAKCIIGEPTPGKMLELASYYIVKDYLFGDPEPQTYSGATEPAPQPETIQTSADTEFLQMCHGKDAGKVMDIMDELMDTMKVIQPRVYDSVMRRVAEIK